MVLYVLIYLFMYGFPKMVVISLKLFIKITYNSSYTLTFYTQDTYILIYFSIVSKLILLYTSVL